jgi:hypothetical protein
MIELLHAEADLLLNRLEDVSGKAFVGWNAA